MKLLKNFFNDTLIYYGIVKIYDSKNIEYEWSKNRKLNLNELLDAITNNESITNNSYQK